MNKNQQLRRVVGVPGAVLLGLGSILGTGVFVSLGIAAEVGGATVVAAVILAALVATCNGLSSAQLAASHPVSGGSYEYGYRYLSPSLGFVAGWMFLCAKSASAATAALGVAAYVLLLVDPSWARAEVGVAFATVALMTLVVLGGLRRSARANSWIVTVTVLSLGLFVAAGLPLASTNGEQHLGPLLVIEQWDARSLLHATALMFVAYTGYGRVATLGEEIVEPRRNIPRAIIVTLGVTMLLYTAVVLIAVAASGAPALAQATQESAAPLSRLAHSFRVPGVPTLVRVGAVTAMLGVLLNLLLGISRVVLAMARRSDLPPALAHVDSHGSPRAAVVVVGVLIAGLVLLGDVKTTWSFSAFTVLVYYALTNLAALRLPVAARLYPRWVSWFGLLSCLGLAAWVKAEVWLAGVSLIALGLLWHTLARRMVSRG